MFVWKSPLSINNPGAVCFCSLSTDSDCGSSCSEWSSSISFDFVVISVSVLSKPNVCDTSWKKYYHFPCYFQIKQKNIKNKVSFLIRVFKMTVTCSSVDADRLSPLPLLNSLWALAFNSFGCGVFCRTNGVWNNHNKLLRKCVIRKRKICGLGKNKTLSFYFQLM